MARSDLRFASEQLRGVYDFEAYRSLIASTSDRAKDVEYVKKWNKVASATRDEDPSSQTLFFYRDAFESALTTIGELGMGEIDLTNHVTWLGLRDLVIDANRLVTLPDLAHRDTSGLRISVFDVVQSVAMLLDVVGRICDEDLRDRAVATDARRFRIRWTPIYVDFVCGRGGAWLAYIDDMGAEAAAVRGISWAQQRDRYAAMRISDYLGRLSRTFSLESDAAGRLFSSQMLLCASVFDRIQRMTWDRDGAEQPRSEDAVRSVRLDVLRPLMGALLPPTSPGDDLYGYTEAFGVSAPGCVTNIALSFETSARASFSRVLASEREAVQAKEQASRERRLPR